MTKFYFLKMCLTSLKSRIYQSLLTDDYLRTFLRRCCFLLLLMGALAVQSNAQTKYFVNADGGNDTNDGLSWASSFQTLQKGIETTIEGDSIWVAKGIYTPSKDTWGVETPSDNRTKTFYINKNIKLYGGFAGTEMALSERMLEGVDTTFLDGALSAMDSAYHVMYIDGSASPITNEMILDGFTFRHGRASGGPNRGGAIYNNGQSGASSPIIINATFYNNSAGSSGGAIFNYGGGGIGNPIIINATFYNNSAGEGGAIHNEALGGICNPIIRNATFYNNSALSGGAIYSFANSPTASSSPSIINSVFYNNSAAEGGAIGNYELFGGKLNLSIVNSLFYNNSTSGEFINRGGAISIEASDNTSSPSIVNTTFYNNSSKDGGAIFNTFATLSIQNGIFWGNKKNDAIDVAGADIEDINSTTTTITHSLTQENSEHSTGTGILNNQDPQFADAANGDFRLLAGSPAIDMGDNTAIPMGITTDLGDNMRIQDEIVDMGAYEGEVIILCPEDLATFTTPVVSITTNSICRDRARTPSGGKLTAPTAACPEGATLQYSTDEMDWTAILPTYDQENAMTIYTRCNCNSDNMVSSNTASVTTMPDACPSYTANQYCWDELTSTVDSLSTITYLGEDGEGNSYFSAYVDFRDRKLYKSDGSSLVDMTPEGGPWSYIYPPQFLSGGTSIDGAGALYFIIYASDSDQKLYKSDGSSLVNMTPDKPDGGTWSSISSEGTDVAGALYFAIYSDRNNQKLYKSDGSSYLVNMTPDGGPWSSISSRGTGREGGLYFVIHSNATDQKLYKIDGSSLVDVTPDKPDGGTWSRISSEGTDGEGVLYFVLYSNSTDKKLYKGDGNNKLVPVMTPNGGPWNFIISQGTDGDGALYFVIYSSSNDQKLYKIDGSSLVDVTPDKPDGGTWGNIDSYGTDGAGALYFQFSSSSSDRKLYKSDGSSLVEVTPDGGPWSSVFFRGTDGAGALYFVIYSSSNDQKLYKSDGSSLVVITPDGGPWSSIFSHGTDGAGALYFVIYSNRSDRKLYKSDGSNLIDITPEGGPWSIDSKGTDSQGNIYFEIYSNRNDKKLFYNYPGPCPNDLTVSSLLPTSVELQWQDNCDMADKWEIEYGTPGFTQGMGTTITVSENPYTLTDLLPNTDYEFYVRANCQGDEGTSGWGLANAFNTTPSVAVFDATLAEGDEGTQNMTFQISLSAAFSSDLQIACTTTDFTAIAGEDYTAVETTVTIPAGTFNTTVSVPILGDVLPENNEQFYLSVRILPVTTNSLTGVLPELKDGLALGHILDDDFGNNQTTGVDSFAVCGNQLILNGTPTQGVEAGTWTVLNSTVGAGTFSDPNSFSALYNGLNGATDSLLWTIQVNNTILHQDTVVIIFNPDSDNDGVQDCIDVCLGGNDQLDSDGDGAPDECDCNPIDAGDSFLSVDEVGDETVFQSSNRLFSKAIIAADLDITFKAGQEITLYQGFHATAGSNFLAELVYCRNPMGKVFKETIAETSAGSSTRTTLTAQTIAKGPINLTVTPNPIHQDAIIGIELPTNTTVALTLYDLNGKLLKTLLRTAEQAAGTHHFSLQAGYLPSGLYLLQLRSATEVITKKVMVQR